MRTNKKVTGVEYFYTSSHIVFQTRKSTIFKRISSKINCRFRRVPVPGKIDGFGPVLVEKTSEAEEEVVVAVVVVVVEEEEEGKEKDFRKELIGNEESTI